MDIVKYSEVSRNHRILGEMAVRAGVRLTEIWYTALVFKIVIKN